MTVVSQALPSISAGSDGFVPFGVNKLQDSGSLNAKSVAEIDRRDWRAVRSPVHFDGLHKRLHAIISQHRDGSETEVSLLAILGEEVGTLSSARLRRDESDQWQFVDDSNRQLHPKAMTNELADCCALVADRGATQIVRTERGSVLLAAVGLGTDELVYVEVTSDQVHRALMVLELVLDYWRFGLSRHKIQRQQRRLESLAALIELNSKLEGAASMHQACQCLVDELALYLQLENVVIGKLNRNRSRIDLRASSQFRSLDTGSEIYRSMSSALHECLIREGEGEGVWPCPKGKEELHLAHRQLAISCQAESVFSMPIESLDGTSWGVLLLMGSSEQIRNARLRPFLKAAIPHWATALQLVERVDPTYAGRLAQWICRHNRRQKYIFLGAAMVMAGILMFPVRYRVPCPCVIEADQRRFAVAPFDGIVDQGVVEPGDLVKTGDLLATMDGQAIRFELAAVQAKREQASKQRDVDLAEGNISATIRSELETANLMARQSLLEYQLNRIELRCPVDGVVLSGTRDHAEGAAVKMGETLYVVSPLDQMRIELLVDDHDIAEIEPGHRVWLRVDGDEERRRTVEVVRIRPQSEIRDARNRFVVECRIDNPDGELRPGMRGHARILAKRHPLGWNLFHRPYQIVVSWLCWW